MKIQTNNQSGFSLIELMVVVAIIGILAAVAVPQFSKFQNKARQAEAKVLLSAIGTGEGAFQAEWNGYSTTMANMGVVVSGNYYAAGFAATCGTYATGLNPNYPAEGSAGAGVTSVGYTGNHAKIANSDCDNYNNQADTYVAGAGTRFSSVNADDTWTLSQAGVLSHTSGSAGE